MSSRWLDAADLLEEVRREVGGACRLVRGTELRLAGARASLSPHLKLRVQAARADLVALLEACEQEASTPEPGPAPDAEVAPLSWGQTQLYRAMQISAGAGLFHMSDVLHIVGSVDVPRFRQCVEDTLRRHRALRVRFETSSTALEGVVQVFEPRMPVSCEVLDWSGLPPAERVVAFEAEVHRFRSRPFDLSCGPLFRMQLLVLAPGECCFMMTVHHLVCDDASMALLQRELMVRLQVHGPTQPVLPEDASYFAFAHHNAGGPKSASGIRKLAYWRHQLQGLPALLPLPTDAPRPDMRTASSRTVISRLRPEVAAMLAALARQERTSLFAVLLAAYFVFLWRLSHRRRVPVASLVANRDDERFESTVGLLYNTVVFVGEVDPEAPALELVRRTRDDVLTVLEHQSIPFQFLVDHLDPPRHPAIAPFAQCMFAFMGDTGQPFRLEGARLHKHGGMDAGSVYDLRLTAYEKAGGLEFVLEYDAALFETATAVAFLRVYEVLVESLSRMPSQRVRDLSVCPDGEGGPGADHPATQVVLDEWQRPVAPGLVGRLHVPAGDGSKEGLWARLLANGTVHRLPETARKVHVRGHKVQASALVAAFEALPEVRQAVAVDDAHGAAVLCLCPRSAAVTRDTQSLLDRVQWPAHLMPNRIRVVPWLPVLVSDVVDTDLLLRLGGELTGIRKRDAAPGTEAALLAIFRRELQQPELGPDDDFVSAGGNSLTGTLVIAAVNRRLSVRLTLRQLLEARTVARMATVVDSARQSRASRMTE